MAFVKHSVSNLDIISGFSYSYYIEFIELKRRKLHLMMKKKHLTKVSSIFKKVISHNIYKPINGMIRESYPRHYRPLD